MNIKKINSILIIPINKLKLFITKYISLYNKGSKINVKFYY